jgi:hypothetical protein
VTLSLLPSGSAVALGPVWAALCGAWAAGSWRWESEALLALVVTIFCVEVLWSSWRAQLIDLDWAAYLARHPLPTRGDPMLTLPYTTPWSPVGRALKGWAQLRRWMRETLSPERRGAVLALPVLPPLILLLSALVSWQLLVLSLAALALTLIEWRIARRGSTHTALQAGLEIGLSWLAGHVAFAPLTAISFTLACGYALSYQGALACTCPRDAGPEGRSWPLALFFGGQLVALVVVLLGGKPGAPVAATGMGLLLAPQWLLLARLQTGKGGVDYLRRAAPFLMLAMPIAAWTV